MPPFSVSVNRSEETSLDIPNPQSSHHNTECMYFKAFNALHILCSKPFACSQANHLNAPQYPGAGLILSPDFSSNTLVFLGFVFSSKLVRRAISLASERLLLIRQMTKYPDVMMTKAAMKPTMTPISCPVPGPG